MAEAEIKLCRDCAFFRPAERNPSGDLGKCAAPQNATSVTSFITGDTVNGWRNEWAEIQRNNPSAERCGPDAKWFQPKIAQAAE